MLAFVPAIWYITNHLKMKQLKIIAFTFAHKSVIWSKLSEDGFISVLPGMSNGPRGPASKMAQSQGWQVGGAC